MSNKQLNWNYLNTLTELHFPLFIEEKQNLNSLKHNRSITRKKTITFQMSLQFCYSNNLRHYLESWSISLMYRFIMLQSRVTLYNSITSSPLLLSCYLLFIIVTNRTERNMTEGSRAHVAYLHDHVFPRISLLLFSCFSICYSYWISR